jgi:hypothetical protein
MRQRTAYELVGDWLLVFVSVVVAIGALRPRSGRWFFCPKGMSDAGVGAGSSTYVTTHGDVSTILSAAGDAYAAADAPLESDASVDDDGADP